MTVANDSVFKGLGGDGIDTLSLTTLTVGAGPNMVLVAFVFTEIADTQPSVHWDPTGANQAMTLIDSMADTGVSFGKIWAFGLVAPMAGNKTLTATWTGSQNSNSGILTAASFTGANQIGGSTTFKNVSKSTNAAATSGSNVITSATGDMAVNSFMCFEVITLSNFSTGSYVNNATSDLDGTGQYGAGASTVTFNAAFNSAEPWTTLGFDIAAASGGAPPASSYAGLSMMGMG